MESGSVEKTHSDTDCGWIQVLPSGNTVEDMKDGKRLLGAGLCGVMWIVKGGKEVQG